MNMNVRSKRTTPMNLFQNMAIRTRLHPDDFELPLIEHQVMNLLVLPSAKATIVRGKAEAHV
jgi:hypothetical protein